MTSFRGGCLLCLIVGQNSGRVGFGLWMGSNPPPSAVSRGSGRIERE